MPVLALPYYVQYCSRDLPTSFIRFDCMQTSSSEGPHSCTDSGLPLAKALHYELFLSALERPHRFQDEKISATELARVLPYTLRPRLGWVIASENHLWNTRASTLSTHKVYTHLQRLGKCMVKIGIPFTLSIDIFTLGVKTTPAKDGKRNNC